MSPARILVVDDEPTVLEMCVRSLELAGHKVECASSGQEALEKARRETFDVFISDLKMPQMDGLEACQAVRAINPDTATIIMTGFGTMESAIEALKLGVSEFVLKPFRPDELNAAVERALSKQRLERENARLKALIPLFNLSRVFMTSVDLGVIPKHVVRIAREEMQADSASLMLLNEEGELTIHAAEGLPPEVILQTHQKADEGIAGYVLQHREPLILQGDISQDPRFKNLKGKEQLTSAISLPIIHKDKALGVLNVARMREAPPFTDADVEFLSVLASQAAIAIENARLFQEIRQAYERLAELDHLKSEFISIASHELRTPLAILLAYASILEEEITGQSKEYLDQVVESAMQLKAIIDEMVSLRRLDTGETQVEITEVSITPIVESLLEEFGPLAERKEIHLEVDLPEKLPPVRSDAQVLRLILSNLLSNAIKFTPEGGAVRLFAREERDRLLLGISDTGPGIPPQDLERIFERFYQVENSLRREHGGIGLGLSIAKEMAELIDGRIWAESELGKGSTFYLSLPKVSK